MQNKRVAWVREDLLDCHPDPGQGFSAVCAGMGLTAADCFNCPFPACLDDLPSVRGNGVRNSLNNHLTAWRAQTRKVPGPLRNYWLREKVRAWLYQVGLNKCRDMVRWPNRYDPEMVEAARSFVAIVGKP